MAALHWIHDNIAPFGGDPKRVTIAGQGSSGAAFVHLLMLSPLARGMTLNRSCSKTWNSSFYDDRIGSIHKCHPLDVFRCHHPNHSWSNHSTPFISYSILLMILLRDSVSSHRREVPQEEKHVKIWIIMIQLVLFRTVLLEEIWSGEMLMKGWNFLFFFSC